MKAYIFSAFIVLVSQLISCQNENRMLRGNDFDLFKTSPVWDLAKAVEKQDTFKIISLLAKDKLAIDFEESTYGQTLLHLSVQHLLFNSTQCLLNNGANPNHTNKWGGESPIHDLVNICEERALDILKLLIDSGGDPNLLSAHTERKVESAHPYSVLMRACQYPCNTSIELVRYLVEAGADVNFKNNYGTSSIQKALTSNNYEIAIYLLNNGVDYREPVFYNISNEPKYLTDMLRFDYFRLDSEVYQRKLYFISFLKGLGVDYYSAPIPKRYIERAKEDYPDTWQEYLKRY